MFDKNSMPGSIIKAYRNKPLNSGTLKLSDPLIDNNSEIVAIAPTVKAIIRFIPVGFS
jgi:hypothetical protein